LPDTYDLRAKSCFRIILFISFILDAVLLIVSRKCSYGHDKQNLSALIREKERPYVFRPRPKLNVLDYSKVLLSCRSYAEMSVEKKS